MTGACRVLALVSAVVSASLAAGTASAQKSGGAEGASSGQPGQHVDPRGGDVFHCRADDGGLQ